jgi:hypothetical protein
LRNTHQLTPNAIAPERAPHKNDNLADVLGVTSLGGRLNRNEAAHPVPYFGHEQGALGILFGSRDQTFLFVDRTERIFEGGEAILNSVVKDFTKGRRVIATRGPNGQTRTLFRGSHGMILAFGPNEWRFRLMRKQARMPSTLAGGVRCALRRFCRGFWSRAS